VWISIPDTHTNPDSTLYIRFAAYTSKFKQFYKCVAHSLF
jgi:hypothetical protein